jgi:hypothetical protein
MLLTLETPSVGRARIVQEGSFCSEKRKQGSVNKNPLSYEVENLDQGRNLLACVWRMAIHEVPLNTQYLVLLNCYCGLQKQQSSTS